MKINQELWISTSVNNNMGVSPAELPVTYRKVSPRQVERSRARAVKYRNTECMHSSNTPSPQSPSDVSTKLDYSQPITRSRAKLDIESIRHSDVVDGTQLSPSSDVDISVSSTSTAINPSPDQSPIMAPVTPSSLRNNSFVIPITLSPTVRDVGSETHSIESQDVATQSDIVIFPFLRDFATFQYSKVDFSPGTPCDSYGCIFADTDVEPNAHFGSLFSPLLYCTDCKLYVCDRCHQLGCHEHHERYLIDQCRRYRPPWSTEFSIHYTTEDTGVMDTPLPPRPTPPLVMCVLNYVYVLNKD